MSVGEKINICYVLDQGYVSYLNRHLQSLLTYHDPKELNIHIISLKPLKGISNDIVYTTHVIELDKHINFKYKSKQDRITPSTYLKLYIPEVLSDRDKCLYIDADTIIQKPLNTLYFIDPDYIAGTESYLIGKKQAKELNLPYYMLTGVMLMNLKNLREDGFKERCLNLLNSEFVNNIPSELWQHEETLINLVYQGKLTIIHHRYNYCHNRLYEYPLVKEDDAVILHYPGKDKQDMFNNKLVLYPFKTITNKSNILGGKTKYINLKDLVNMLDGKSVAVVGNAKSIFYKSNGYLIDKFDIVIRFNKGFIYNPDAQGNKTDILITAEDLDIRDLLKFGNIPSTILRRRKDINLTGIDLNKINEYVIDNKDIVRVSQGLGGARASSGQIAIGLLRNTNCKRPIHLFGFDFESTPTFYNSLDYKTLHNYKAEKLRAKELEKQNILVIH